MKPGRALILTLVLALLPALPALATVYRQLALEEILAAAEVAFVGTVASLSVVIQDDVPWTVVEFDVEQDLTDDAGKGGEVRLSFLGGDPAGAPALFVSLMPRFEVGERVVLLAYDEEYYSPIVGFNQGLWRLQGNALVDELGRRLSLDQGGGLQADGDGAEAPRLIEALRRELGGER